jgi:hypothetical protein
MPSTRPCVASHLPHNSFGRKEARLPESWKPGRQTGSYAVAVAVGTTIADRPRTDPYERVYAYGSYEG